jgi:hypothetical protein
MLAELDCVELAEWMAYDSLDPFGGVRGDVQAGVVAAAVMNAAGGKGRDDVFCAADFMPDFKPAAKKDPAQLTSKVNQLFGGIAAKFK